MAKGKAEHDARMELLNRFGKDLARRAKSKCELCEVSGQSLKIVELPPAPREPDYDRCLMLCDSCGEAANAPQKLTPGDHLRFLVQSVWSETPVVQALSLRLLRKLAGNQSWAQECLETVFVDEEIEAMALD